MCARPPGPSTVSAPTVPLIVVVGTGTTCAAGSRLRRHAHRGNVHNGADSRDHCRSHLMSPARPRADVGVRTASGVWNNVPSLRGVAGLGPNRVYDAARSRGKVAIQPWA